VPEPPNPLSNAVGGFRLLASWAASTTAEPVEAPDQIGWRPALPDIRPAGQVNDPFPAGYRAAPGRCPGRPGPPPGLPAPAREGTGPATRSSADWYSAARLPLAHIGMFRSGPTLRTTW
jgi:hypothetical protein